MMAAETPDHYPIWRLEKQNTRFEIHVGRAGFNKKNLATDGFVVARSIAYSLKEQETNFRADLSLVLCKKSGEQSNKPPPQVPGGTCTAVAEYLIYDQGIPDEQAAIHEVAEKLKLITNKLFASPHTHATPEDRLKELNSLLPVILKAESL